MTHWTVQRIFRPLGTMTTKYFLSVTVRWSILRPRRICHNLQPRLWTRSTVCADSLKYIWASGDTSPLTLSQRNSWGNSSSPSRMLNPILFDENTQVFLKLTVFFLNYELLCKYEYASWPSSDNFWTEDLWHCSIRLSENSKSGF